MSANCTCSNIQYLQTWRIHLSKAVERQVLFGFNIGGPTDLFQRPSLVVYVKLLNNVLSFCTFAESKLLIVLDFASILWSRPVKVCVDLEIFGQRKNALLNAKHTFNFSGTIVHLIKQVADFGH